MKHDYFKLSSLLTFVLVSCQCIAQDIIVTNNANKIEAKIIEVSKSEIRYKEADNIDGPTFVLETQDIISILYANGKVVVYNQEQKQETPKRYSEEDEELKAWIEESDKETEQARKAKRAETMQKMSEDGIRQAHEERQMEQQAKLQMQLQQNLEELGTAINDLRQTNNSYVLEIINATKFPFRINLDGQILGVVNPYKISRFLVPVERYGRMQAIQTSGYMFSPTIKEYRVSPQKKQTKVSYRIQ